MPYKQHEHAVWTRLYQRMLPCWERSATPVFLDGICKLGLKPDHVPELSEVNALLAPLTGFQAVPVAGYVPAAEFFSHLKERRFPTVTKVRSESQMDYLPEPDIFHDVAGHVPMHTSPVFADTLASYGALAAELHDEERVSGALARFFWFTIEFGLMDTPQGLRAYGSGLLSSFGELDYALHSPNVTRRPFDLAEVLATPFEIDRFQNCLYVVDSFDQLYDAVGQLRSQFSALSFGQKKHDHRSQ